MSLRKFPPKIELQMRRIWLPIIAMAMSGCFTLVPNSDQTYIGNKESDEISGIERLPSSISDPSLKKNRTETPAPGTVRIVQLDPNMPTEGLASDDKEVIKLEEFDQYDPWTEPSPKLRNFIFRESGINKYVQGYDHLKKDMLFLRAQENSLDQLLKRYPKIPQPVLRELQISIGKLKGAHK